MSPTSPASHDADVSQAHHDDAMTFLEVMQQAGTVYAAAAAAEGQEYQTAEAGALFSLAMGQAGLHAQLSVAAAVRDQAAATRELAALLEAEVKWLRP
jgi:hypothetical protein